MSGMSAHFHMRARVCLSACHLCIMCVVCVSIFVLCVCPPFLKREAMWCMNVVDLQMCVVTSQIHVLLLLWSVCVRVSVCGCLTLSVPGVAGARAGCPEAPVTCEVAKGEWMTCEQQQKKQKKGAGSPRVLRVSPQLVD